MKTSHFIIAALLYGTCLNVAAQEVTVGPRGGTAIVCKGDLRDIMHPGKATASPSKVKMADMTGSEAVVSYRDRITNMPGYLDQFIDQYILAANTILEGGTNWLSDPLMASQENGIYYYPLKEETFNIDFSFEPGSSLDVIDQKAKAVVQAVVNQESDSLSSFMPYAFLSVRFDHPETFWIGASYNSDLTYSYTYKFNYFSGEGTITCSIIVRFILRDTSSFDIRCNAYLAQYNYRNTANISQGVKLFHSSVQSILDQCQSYSRYRMLRKMHDWLTHHNCHNHFYSVGYREDALGGTPWSPISALVGNVKQAAPVCEGYARAMKVLCDKTNIPCILMSGKAAANSFDLADNHMWNYVQMEDGNWYALDATFDDPIVPGINYQAISAYESHKWFLIGGMEEVDEDWSFLDSHPEQWAMNYPNNGHLNWELLPGPVLADKYYVPDPFDPDGDGATTQEDVRIMAEMIVNDDDDIEDIDGNSRITIGDLVHLINRSLP